MSEKKKSSWESPPRVLDFFGGRKRGNYDSVWRAASIPGVSLYQGKAGLRSRFIQSYTSSRLTPPVNGSGRPLPTRAPCSRQRSNSQQQPRCGPDAVLEEQVESYLHNDNNDQEEALLNNSTNTILDETVSPEPYIVTATEVVDDQNPIQQVVQQLREQLDQERRRNSEIVRAQIVSIETRSDESFNNRNSSDASTGSQSASPIFQVSEQIKSNSKLPSSASKLYGRDTELQVLQSRLEKIMLKNPKEANSEVPPKQLVLISGTAGVGKTALATSLQDQVNQCKGLFVKGKFNNMSTTSDSVSSDHNYGIGNNDHPYAGLSAACGEICQHVLTHLRGAPFQQFRQGLYECIHYPPGAADSSSDNQHLHHHHWISLISKVIPGCDKIIGEAQDVCDEDDTSYVNNESHDDHSGCQPQTFQDNKTWLHYVVRGFLRLAASTFAPLVVLLDDFQWCDTASMDLLEVILNDADCSGLMMIGTNRTTDNENVTAAECKPSFPCLARLQNLAETHDGQCHFDLTDIHLDNLSINDFNHVIGDMLSVDDSEITVELAELCHARTLGNIFCLEQFLTQIAESGLLTYDRRVEQWVWKIKRIQDQTMPTANVTGLLMERMKNMPFDLKQFLSVTACLGSDFDLDLLKCVWNDIQASDVCLEHGQTQNAVERCLCLAISERFIEERSPMRYKWSHDIVQETALMLLSPDERKELKARIVTALLAKSNQAMIDSNIFLIANLLYGTENESTHPTLRSEIYLRASRKAAQMSALDSAAIYSTKGIEFLPSNAWQSCYDMALDLYSTAAEMEGFLGHIEEMEKYCDTVLNLPANICPVNHKIRVLTVRTFFETVNHNPRKAVELCLDALKQVGCTFPQLHACRICQRHIGIVRIQLSAKSLSEVKLRNLRQETLQDATTTLQMLLSLVTATYNTGDPLFDHAAIRAYRLATSSKLCQYTPTILALSAMLVMSTSGDVKTAAALANRALLLQDKISCTRSYARTIYTCYAFVYPWTMPLGSVFNPLVEAYKSGMVFADTRSSAFASLTGVVVLRFVGGSPLNMVESECSHYASLIEEHGGLLYADAIRIFWQAVLNLMGCSQNTTDLRGQALPSPEKMCESLFLKTLVQHNQCTLHAYFGSYEQGANLALAIGETMSKQFPGHPLIPANLFYRGLLLFAKARKTKTRRFIAQATKCRATMKRFARKGNPNVQHYDVLFDAEYSALKKKYQLAERFFQSAIVSATQNGFHSDAALANERYALFLLHDLGDEQLAIMRIKKASRLYLEWGAAKLVERMKVQYADLLSSPSD